MPHQSGSVGSGVLVWHEGAILVTRRLLRSDYQYSIIAVTDSAGGSIAINTYDEYGIHAATSLDRFA